MESITIRFRKERDTKNTVKFDEQPEPGRPPIVGSLYVQKWFVGAVAELTVRLEGIAAPAQPTRFTV